MVYVPRLTLVPPNPWIDALWYMIISCENKSGISRPRDTDLVSRFKIFYFIRNLEPIWNSTGGHPPACTSEAGDLWRPPRVQTFESTEGLLQVELHLRNYLELLRTERSYKFSTWPCPRRRHYPWSLMNDLHRTFGIKYWHSRLDSPSMTTSLGPTLGARLVVFFLATM